MNGEIVVRKAIQGLSKAQFLDKQDEYFYYIYKRETNYILHLFDFSKRGLQEIHKFEIPFFKPNFEYIKLEPQNQLFFVHNRISSLEVFGREGPKLASLETIELKFAVVDFHARPQRVFIIFSDVR